MSGDPVVKVKNDSERLKEELKGLLKSNKYLHDILYDVAGFCKEKFDKEVVVTEILRTQEEQDKYYAKDEAYQKKKKTSPHQLGHALDLRDWTFTKDQIKEIVEYVNGKFNKTNSYAWTALDHNVGQGYHFHIQGVEKK
jgi:hypothetical protein